MRVSLKSDLQNIYRELPHVYRFGNPIVSLASYGIVGFGWKKQILIAGLSIESLKRTNNAVFILPKPLNEGQEGQVELWSPFGRESLQFWQDIPHEPGKTFLVTTSIIMPTTAACVDGEDSEDNYRESENNELSFRCQNNKGAFKAICHSHFGRNGACQVFVLRSEFTGRLVKVNMFDASKTPLGLNVCDLLAQI